MYFFHRFLVSNRRRRRYQNAVKRVSRATAPLRASPNNRREGPGERNVRVAR